ncbi:chorismate mutase [Halarsenatibacter silvermanii]|uniref:chorismate mutase n=1 Tax=Halarsenatibacter silvermanii TaxID=321763 RepID=A0A1G9NVE9_9FIRM|nr:chorismate mutase [Halarsenatibacter silvermanii]SDL89955.1 chorismate mutase [Halarsenatibacter silvermanii]
MFAIRTAITIEEDNEDEIRKAVKKMTDELFNKNRIEFEEIVSIIFSSTADISSLYPAQAFRELGYEGIPLFSCQEPEIEDGMEKCIRALFHVESARIEQQDIKHIYLRRARELRPDLVD